MATLQNRLVKRFLVIVLLPMTILAGVTIWIVRDYLNSGLTDRLESSGRGVDLMITALEEDLLARGVSLAADASLRTAVVTADRQTALDILSRSLTVYAVDVAIVADARGVVLARGQDPGRYSDVVSGDKHWGLALRGEGSAALDENEPGLAIEVTLPLREEGGVVGALRLAKGLDHALLMTLHELFDVEISVFHGGLVQATTFTASDSLGHPVLDALTSQVLEGGAPLIGRVEIGEHPYLVMVRPIADEDGEILGAYHLALSTAATGRAATTLTLLFIAAAVVLALVTFPVSNRVAANIVRPVKSLLGHARAVAKGDLDSRVEVRGTDEIAKLAEGFNQMSEDLKSSTTSIAELNREIEERERAEAEAISLRNYLRDIFDSIESVLVGVNSDAIVTHWNRAAERVTGVDAPHAVGRLVRKLLPQVAKRPDLLETAIGDRRSKQVAVTTSNGEDRRVEEITVYPLGVDGSPHAVIRIDDVTERLELEERFRQSEKMQVIGQIAGGVAHDFNNQLHVIGLCAEELRRSITDTILLGQLETIEAAATRSADLTRQLLAFSRKAQVSDETIDIREMIDVVVSILDRVVDRKVTVRTEVGDDDLHVTGDKSLLQNALLNLGLNARDAIDGVGNITFVAKRVRLDGAPAWAVVGEDLPPGTYVSVEVSDDGKGMDESVARRIFEPFFTTKGRGTGLGLSAVYGTVGQLEGALSFRSSPGEGTAFTILLPVADVDTGKVTGERPEIETEKMAGELHVMLVDDEEGIVRATKRSLRIMGCKCTAFTRPRDAIGWYRENWESIDLVILDMILPEMDGAETFEALKAIHPEIRAIIATGFGEHGSLERAQAAGVVGTILKPYTQEDLADLLKTHGRAG